MGDEAACSCSTLPGKGGGAGGLALAILAAIGLILRRK
jgi:MYXO-CTERM domain-containing protein